MSTAVGNIPPHSLRNSILRNILQGILAVQYPSADQLRIYCDIGRFRVIEIDEDGAETPADIRWLMSDEPRAESVRSVLKQLSDHDGIPAEGLAVPLEHLESYPQPRRRD